MAPDGTANNTGEQAIYATGSVERANRVNNNNSPTPIVNSVVLGNKVLLSNIKNHRLYRGRN